MQISLDETIRKAAAGDLSAIESALLHFHDPLLLFIQHGLPKHVAIAPEDVLQETMVEAFRGVRTLDARGGDAFFGWLKTIARTRMLNMIEAAGAKKRGGNRRQQIAPATPDATVTSILGLLAGPDQTPSRIVRRAEAVDILSTALSKLEPERRRILDLRFGQGLSIEEIARQENKGESAIKMLIHRTIKSLKDAIRSDFEDFSIGE